MADSVTQGRTLTHREEIQWAVNDIRGELEQLVEDLDAAEDRDKRIALQEQIDGKQNVILILEMELDMAGEDE